MQKDRDEKRSLCGKKGSELCEHINTLCLLIKTSYSERCRPLQTEETK